MLATAELLKVPAAVAKAGADCKLLDDVEDLGRELNFGSLDIVVGMTGGSTRHRGGADIRPHPLHHQRNRARESAGTEKIVRKKSLVSFKGIFQA